eukprot:scaffold26268_cov103-Cylindrotheca_fusiformis.AAC.1
MTERRFCRISNDTLESRQHPEFNFAFDFSHFSLSAQLEDMLGPANGRYHISAYLDCNRR